MKYSKIVILVVIVLIALGGIFMFNFFKDRSTIENSLSNEEQIVLSRYKEMQQAMVDKDIEKLREIVKDDTTFTHMSGRTQTREEYFADIESKALDYQSYTIENPVVTIDGNKATLKARVTLTANAYGAQGSYPFNVNAHFEKINNEWLYTN